MRTILCLALALLLTACGGGGVGVGAESGGAGADARVDGAVPLVAFYGDSITSGTHRGGTEAWTPAVWSPTPVQHIAVLANVAAMDYSYDGASSADARIAHDASDVVVIRFGVADTVYGLAPDVFAGHITRLVGEAQALGKQVLLTGLTRTSSGDTLQLDAVMREHAATLGVGFVDVYALPFTPDELADALHPGEAYSRRVGQAVAAAVRGVVSAARNSRNNHTAEQTQ